MDSCSLTADISEAFLRQCITDMAVRTDIFYSKEKNMMDPITVIVDQDQIKFTPDGKIAVLDAIASLCSGKDNHALWESLLVQHPDLAEVCENYPFSHQRQSLVTDGSGWQKIQSALFDHLIETE